MNRKELRQHILGRLGDGDFTEDTSTAYPAGLLNSAINEGLKQFCLDTLCLRSSGNITLVAGTAAYNFAALTGFKDSDSDCWFLRELRVKHGSTILEKWTKAEMDAESGDASWEDEDDGDPSRYIMTGETEIMLSPPPDASGTLAVEMAKRAELLSEDTTNAEIPVTWHYAIVWYGCFFCRMADGDDIEEDKFGKLYLREIAKYWRLKNFDPQRPKGFNDGTYQAREAYKKGY